MLGEVVRDHNAPASLRGQAYAEVLAGLFRAAQHDLELADKADGGKVVPPWAELARVFSHSDAAALAKTVAARPDDPLPLYLRFLTLHRTAFFMGDELLACRGEIIPAGRAVLEKVPDCYSVHDRMAELAGVNNLHSSTSIGMELFSTAVPRRVAALPGLPESIAESISRATGDEVDLRKRLVAAAAQDPSDLSWGVLARQFREIRERKQEVILLPLQRVDNDLYMHIMQLDAKHTSQGTVQGQEIVTVGAGDGRATAAHNLLKYHPDSPLGRAALIATRWKEAQPRVETWVKDQAAATPSSSPCWECTG